MPRDATLQGHSERPSAKRRNHPTEEQKRRWQANKRRKQLERRAQGLCSWCGNKPVPGRRMCERCAEAGLGRWYISQERKGLWKGWKRGKSVESSGA